MLKYQDDSDAVYFIIKDFSSWHPGVYHIITNQLFLCGFIGYFTSHGVKSQDSNHAITPAYIDICSPMTSVEKKQSQCERNFEFSSFLFYKETRL